MRNCTVVFVGVLAVVFSGMSSPSGAAPSGSPVPRLFGSFQPVVGAWAEYGVVDKAAGKKSFMKMAVVGEEGDAYWYEVTINETGHRNTVKMLVVGNPNDPKNIRRLILKSGPNPAVEMPREFITMGRRMAGYMFQQLSGVSNDTRADLRAVEAGQGEITVPAGTFRVLHKRIEDGSGKVLARYDFDPGVRPFGVVTSEAGKTRMVLMDHGADATTSIQEEPIPFSGPPAMPGGMPRGAPPGMTPPTPGGLHAD